MTYLVFGTVLAAMLSVPFVASARGIAAEMPCAQSKKVFGILRKFARGAQSLSENIRRDYKVFGA